MGALRGIGLVVTATIVHLILCYSVIDIHFQSPVSSGIPPVWPDTKPHSKRIVLIVADGEPTAAHAPNGKHQHCGCICLLYLTSMTFSTGKVHIAEPL